MEFSENTSKTLMNYLSTDEKPVSIPEMMAFWSTLEDWEKEYFRTAQLT